jgi:hypothetical protein
MRPRQGRRRPRYLSALTALLVLPVLAPSARADLVWEAQGFSSGQAITAGTSVTASTGTGVSIVRSEHSDNDGGTFDLTTGGNADFVTYQSGRLGAHRGYLEMSLDNENNDPVDYVELTLNFDKPITDLQFSLLDVDGNNNWDDAVEVYIDGLNARDNPDLLAINGDYNGPDDKPYMHGWESIGRVAGNGQTRGNIDLDFGSTILSQLTIRFFTTTDASLDPNSQEVGLSDLRFNEAVPEPSSIACVSLFLALMALRHRAARRPRPASA